MTSSSGTCFRHIRHSHHPKRFHIPLLHIRSHLDCIDLHLNLLSRMTANSTGTCHHSCCRIARLSSWKAYCQIWDRGRSRRPSSARRGSWEVTLMTSRRLFCSARSWRKSKLRALDSFHCPVRQRLHRCSVIYRIASSICFCHLIPMLLVPMECYPILEHCQFYLRSFDRSCQVHLDSLLFPKNHWPL